MQKIENKKLDVKPKFIITYFCQKCGFDFAITELDKPKCFYCDSYKNWKIVKKQKFSLKNLAGRMKLVNERLKSSLKGAYKAGKESNNFDEDLMLDVMNKIKKLEKNVRSILKQ